MDKFTDVYPQTFFYLSNNFVLRDEGCKLKGVLANELKEVSIMSLLRKVVRIRMCLSKGVEEDLVTLLREYKDIFAWSCIF